MLMLHLHLEQFNHALCSSSTLCTSFTVRSADFPENGMGIRESPCIATFPMAGAYLVSKVVEAVIIAYASEKARFVHQARSGTNHT